MDEINEKLDQVSEELEATENVTEKQITEAEFKVDELEEEKRKLLETAEKREETLKKVIETKSVKESFEEKKEERTMENTKAEYRTAYFKKLLGRELNEEERASVATASTDVAAAMPEETLNTIFAKIVKKVPMIEQITLLRVNGSVQFAVETARTDASDHTENAKIDAEKVQLKPVELSAKEITKLVQISETVKTMTIDAFEGWLTDMLADSLANTIEGKIISEIETNGTSYEGVITADVIRGGIGSLPAMYDANAGFLCPKSLFYNTILGLQDKAKCDIVTREGNEYRIYGYPVRISDKSTKLVLVDAKRFVGNLAQDIQVKSSFDIDTNSYKYLGVAMYDGKLASSDAAIVFTNAAASE